MDGGNREEEDYCLGPGLATTTTVVATSPTSPYSNRLHHHQPSQPSPTRQHLHQNHNLYNYSADRYSPIESHIAHGQGLPRDVSVAAYAAKNLQAVAANATNPATGVAFGDAGQPDDFYREYRGVQSANNTLLPSPIQEDFMASAAAPNTRQPPTTRANGNGIGSKLPGVPGSRVVPRPVHRSASNPVDDRLVGSDGARARSATSNGMPAASRASVKDMKKKFEQNVPQSSSDPRRTASRSSPRDAAPNGTSGRTATGTSGQSSYSTLRTTGADTTRSASIRGTQRTRYTPEDQLSSNSQSFASRISRPRPPLPPNTSKSVTQPTPKPPPNPQTSPSPATRTGSLLFGEILPDELDKVTAGHGINGVRPSRPSESTSEDATRQHRRSTSNIAVEEPTSPTDWYRGAATPQENGHQKPAPRIPKSHSRSQSDLVGSKAAPPSAHTNLPRRKSPADDSRPSSPSSRLPMPVQRLSSGSRPTSAASSRSSSPAAAARRPANSGRTSRPQVTPTNRAKTPTSRTNTPMMRARTPTRAGSSLSGRKPGPSTLPNSNNTRLAAVISAPLPKLSPPLRSSRPRQPVSSATTASSRLKSVEVDRSKSPHKLASRSASRPASRQDVPPARRRKISVGPVDFAERRETIKLKYTKSIRETEAKQARDVAADRRKKELEAAAKAKVKAQARAEAQAQAQAVAASKEKERSKTDEDVAQTEQGEQSLEQPLTIDTAVASGPAHAKSQDPVFDSPTLGIPGAFPGFGSPPINRAEEEAPPSAISETSAVTEFDNEAQTEPPVHEQTALTIGPSEDQAAHVSNDKATNQHQVSVHARATYRDPFEFEDDARDDDESISIKISLDPCSSPQHPSQITPTRSEPDPTPVIPGAFRDELDARFYYEPQHYFEDHPEAQPDHEIEPEAVVEPQQQPEPEALPEAAPEATPVITPEPELLFVPEAESAPETLLESEPEALREVLPGPGLHDELESEYEPKPFVAQPYQTTKVTILGRDDTFLQPVHFKPESDLSRHSDDMGEVVQKEEGPRMNMLEDFLVGRPLKDDIAGLRDSTFTLSEPDTSDGPTGFTEPHHTPDTSNSLAVPPMMSPANRSSQQSVWTDFSMDSAEGHEYSSRDYTNHYGGSDGDQSHSIMDDSRPQSIMTDDASLRQRQYTSGMSPANTSEPFESKERMSYHGKQQHLPELDTGGGFAVPYLSEPIRAAPIPSAPVHSPPPPPEDASRPPSGYYEDPRPSSSMTRDDQMSINFPISRRESEDYPHTLSTPHSLDHISLGGDSATPAQTPIDGEHKITGDVIDKSSAAGKEKNRLTQRQMVIKELVDTEAIFVRDMNVIEEIYKGTAEACPKLDDKTIKLVFRNTHEIISFHTAFLGELKEGVTSVYVPKGRRSPMLKEETAMSDATTIHSVVSTTASAVPSLAASSTTAVSVSGLTTTNVEPDDVRDRQTVIGPAFIRNIEQMRAAHEGFLRTSDVASKRLIEIQQDPAVKVWLNECNEVAKDLTAAWNLDSLLIKPMQRITKYPNLISQLLQYTPADHPDREGLMSARATVEDAILDINKTKKNFELVGQIVGRKRKESDVKAGFARAFGKRVDRLQASSNRPPEDPDYAKLSEKFGDDYLRLQVVLRDVEFYTRQTSAYVHEFLQYLSSIELVMRLQPGAFPEIESKWVQFNVSMRDIEGVVLEQHLTQVRKHVIEPFEQVIRCYQNPLTAMKKRSKRRLDYEKAMALKKSGKKVDKQLAEQLEQYEALNDTLKKELPRLSALTEKMGMICLGNLINIQVRWYLIWKDKVKVVLGGDAHVPEFSDIVTTFTRDFKDMEEQILSIGIINPTSLQSRASQSTMDDSVSMSRVRSRASDVGLARGRGLSVNSDQAPVLPAPDFAKRHSGQFTASPSNAMPSPSHFYHRDYYAGINGQSPRGPASPMQADFSGGVPRPIPPIARPGTGMSYDSSGHPRPSTESGPAMHVRGDSNSMHTSTPGGSDVRRFSGLFHSALPMTDTTEESQRSSRASSRERNISNGYNVLWLAASLFEFNIETTKHEAGYPYLTYQAGEIFDVIAEKGELWLAKNQDDPHDLVGWIWSKHFAKLADS